MFISKIKKKKKTTAKFNETTEEVFTELPPVPDTSVHSRSQRVIKGACFKDGSSPFYSQHAVFFVFSGYVPSDG